MDLRSRFVHPMYRRLGCDLNDGFLLEDVATGYVGLSPMRHSELAVRVVASRGKAAGRTGEAGDSQFAVASGTGRMVRR